MRKPLDQLLADAPRSRATSSGCARRRALRTGDRRGRNPVNALAVDEHGEDGQTLEFLMTQRDDLVPRVTRSSRRRERSISTGPRRCSYDSFGKVRENFRTVSNAVRRGECDVRCARRRALGARSQIQRGAAREAHATDHLLSSGERTLVAVSLLFAIFLTKPSPFCLLDEVDRAPGRRQLGRYVRLLADSKDLTQFIVITHNPRTMQAADAVYGSPCRSPGVSTIVWVRLGSDGAGLMDLVTVGTGTVAPSATRTSACHWVARGNLKILLDCGAGALHASRNFRPAVASGYHVACRTSTRTIGRAPDAGVRPQVHDSAAAPGVPRDPARGRGTAREAAG